METQATSGLILRPAASVVMESFEDGALVLRLNDRHLFELNPTACSVLAHTDGRRSAAEIAILLANEYQVPFEVALQDVIELYRQLLEDGLLETLLTEGCE